MKNVFIILIGLGLMLSAPCFAAEQSVMPSESLAEAQDDTLREHAHKHADPTYVCPMHSQIVRGEPGNCPICGMKLVKKEITPPEPSESLAEAQDDTLREHAHKHADPTYVCPMHSQIVRGEPGSCPICGMKLVKKEPVSTTESASGSAGPVVRLEPSVVQKTGVRTEAVKRETLVRPIRTVGMVEYDEDSLQHVHSRAEGWVEALKVRSVGEAVKKGQVLMELYSPTILSAQQELLVARSSKSLLEPARQRLRLLDVPESVIREIEKTGKAMRRVPVLAPTDGVVAEIGLRDGMYVKPEMTLFSLGELSTVWVDVEVFEQQMDWVHAGDEAEIRIAALPGKVWRGKIDYVYPELDQRTRTLKVRLVFANPNGELKPNMFADVSILTAPRRDVLAISKQAVIRSSEGSHVIRALGDGRFQPVKVETGMENDTLVEIKSGLKAGEDVVVSGQFLIDSESSLQASFQRLNDSAGGGHQHAH